MKWPLSLSLAAVPTVLRAAAAVLAGSAVDEVALNNALGEALGVVLRALFVW